MYKVTVHRTTIWLLLLALFTTPISSGNGDTRRFEEFCPSFDFFLGPAARGDCKEQYEVYRGLKLSEWYTPGCKTCYITNIINCLLSHSDDLRKAEMASAGIILGLMPTILIFVTFTDVEMGLLAFRRPILAFILSAATPAVTPLRSSEHRSLVAILRERKHSIEVPMVSGSLQYAVSAGQYIVALGALGNLYHVIWQLLRWTVFVFIPDVWFATILWAAFGLLCHLLGIGCLYLRVSLQADNPPQSNIVHPPGLKGFANMVWALIKREIQPCARRPPATLHLRGEKEGYLFLFCSWVTSMGEICYIIWGTWMFSGILLLGVNDAVIIAARIFGSVVFCRLVLKYELSAMRGVHGRVNASELPSGE